MKIHFLTKLFMLHQLTNVMIKLNIVADKKNIIFYCHYIGFFVYFGEEINLK